MTFSFFFLSSKLTDTQKQRKEKKKMSRRRQKTALNVNLLFLSHKKSKEPFFSFLQLLLLSLEITRIHTFELGECKYSKLNKTIKDIVFVHIPLCSRWREFKVIHEGLASGLLNGCPQQTSLLVCSRDLSIELRLLGHGFLTSFPKRIT